MTSPRSICIVRLSAIGDVVMMVALVRRLQQALPNARLYWVIGREAYGLLSGLSGVRFIVIDKPTSLLAYWRLYKQLFAYQFDVLLAAQASLRTNLIYPLIRAKRKIGFDKRRAKDCHRLFIDESIAEAEEHIAAGFLRFCTTIMQTKAAPLLTAPIDWQLPIAAEDYAFVQQRLGDCRYVVINPSASKPERNWSCERYIELINTLQSRCSLRVVLSGSPVDKALCQRITEQTGATNLAGMSTLKQLAALLGKAIMLIAPDTGPAHIAAAMGTPVIGLYACVPLTLSGPFFASEHSIDKHQAAVGQFYQGSSPLSNIGPRVHDLRAMGLITVAEVMSKVEALLGLNRSNEQP